jgi:excisionase family DNA binding protein
MESPKLKEKKTVGVSGKWRAYARPYRTVKSDPIRFLQEDTTVEFERQTLSIMKACEVVGVSRRTIYNWMAGGKVEYVRTAGGSVRIFADSLWRTPQHVQAQPQIQH